MDRNCPVSFLLELEVHPEGRLYTLAESSGIKS